MSVKLAYLLEFLVGASSIFKWTMWDLFKRYTLLSESTLRVVMSTMKVSCSKSRVDAINFFFSISLIVESTSPII